MTETWKDVLGHNQYEVSSEGRIRRKAYFLKPHPTKNGGHMQVAIASRLTYVHRVVADVFLSNPEKKRTVNHKNGNPRDNRVENLEWATHSENNLHGYRVNGRSHYAERKICGVAFDGREVRFKSAAAAARHFKVTSGSILSAVKRAGSSCGYRWRWV